MDPEINKRLELVDDADGRTFDGRFMFHQTEVRKLAVLLYHFAQALFGKLQRAYV